MAQRQSFLAWARHLDERVLGPGGLLPDGMDLVDYQVATTLAPASPWSIRLGRPVVLGLMLLSLRLDSATGFALFLVGFLAIAWMSIRVERDIRLAARARSQQAP